MIELINEGTYRLIETKQNHKILYLEDMAYLWIEPANIGEILIATVKPHKADCILSKGRYRLYEVEHEPYFSDLMHLELEYGRDEWQGYLLLTGLPLNHNQKKRIIPTVELLTNNPRLKRRKEHAKFAAM